MSLSKPTRDATDKSSNLQKYSRDLALQAFIRILDLEPSSPENSALTSASLGPSSKRKHASPSRVSRSRSKIPATQSRCRQLSPSSSDDSDGNKVCTPATSAKLLVNYSDSDEDIVEVPSANLTPTVSSPALAHQPKPKLRKNMMSKVIFIDPADAPPPPLLGTNASDKQSRPTADSKTHDRWKTVVKLEMLSTSNTPVYEKKIPEPKFYIVPKSSRLIHQPHHWTVFCAKLAVWLLKDRDANMNQLANLMTDWFNNVSCVEKRNHDGNITCNKALADADTHGSAIIFLLDTFGNSLINSVNNHKLPSHIADIINCTTRRSIDVPDLRKRIEHSIPLGAEPSLLFPVLANTVAISLPSYIIVSKEDHGAIVYRARVLEEFCHSNSNPSYDSLLFSSLKWSSNPSHTFSVSLSAKPAINSYSTDQHKWCYRVKNDIRHQPVHEVTVSAYLSHFVKGDIIPRRLTTHTKPHTATSTVPATTTSPT